MFDTAVSGVPITRDQHIASVKGVLSLCIKDVEVKFYLDQC